jgi:outer membrane receptor protein involved in Fe transport
LDWDQRHTINASFNIGVPKGEHPVVLGVKLPDLWGVNCLWKFGSGLPYTPKGQPITEVENYGTKPYTNTFDVRIYKQMSLQKANLEVFVNILNLFDRKNVDRVNEWTGEPYRFGDADGTTHEIYSRRYMQYLRNPQQFGPPRQIKLGIRLSF